MLRREVEEQTRRAELAEQDAAGYKDDHLRTCVLVADLYAAATGRTGSGPRRGVVEDVADVRLRGEAAEEALTIARKQAAQARETAAECRLEAAHLHRQLSALGVDPEQLAQQVGAGQAVELFGRVYVAREGAGEVLAPAQLLEADGMVCVPIPAGHMLSVTVTPYDSSPTD